MREIKALLRRKINQMGLANRLNEKGVCLAAEDFLKKNLKMMEAKVEFFRNGSLMIKAADATEANELRFFDEEMRYFLNSKGYKVKKIRICC